VYNKVPKPKGKDKLCDKLLQKGLFKIWVQAIKQEIEEKNRTIWGEERLAMASSLVILVVNTLIDC
jgi:hypothetical protein